MSTPKWLHISVFVAVISMVLGMLQAFVLPEIAKAVSTSQSETTLISGRVFSSVNPELSLSGVKVTLFDGLNVKVTEFETDIDGNYHFENHPAGSYKIGFEPNGEYLPEFWQDSSSLETSAVIIQEDSQAITGLDVSLESLSGNVQIQQSVESQSEIIEPGPMQPTASPNAGSQISGVVTNPQGDPVPYANVVLYSSSAIDEYMSLNSTYTNSAGEYIFQGLSAGSYKLRVRAINEFQGMWWDTQSSTVSSARTISITNGQEATGTNFALSLGATISGTVRSAEGPIQANVSVYTLNGNWAGSASTDPVTGQYTISGLGTGSYKLSYSASGNFVTQWWSEKSSQSSANAIAVTSPQTYSGRDVTLVSGFSISGSVLDSSGQPVRGYVYAYDAVNQWQSGGISSWVDDNGDYTIQGLPAGNYKLEFSPQGNYQRQFWPSSNSYSSATAVTVGVGINAPRADFVASQGGTITVNVVDENGAPLTGNAQVNVSNGGNSRTLDSSGSAVFDGLISGSYTVEVTPTGFPSKWWNNKNRNNADVIEISPGSQEVLTFVIGQGAKISGVVTGPNGQVINGGQVIAHPTDQVWSTILSTNINQDGSYELSGLDAGSYKLQFRPNGNFVEQWWGNTEDAYSADPIILGDRQTITGRDVTLIAGASISGSVTNSHGQGMDEPVSVSLSGASTSGQYVNRSSSVNFDGTYSFQGLPEGNYTLSFNPGNYSTYRYEYWNNRFSWREADDISLASGQQLILPNVQLSQELGSISGRLLNSQGIPIQNQWINLSLDSIEGIEYYKNFNTDSQGNFTLSGLPEGDYYLTTNLNSQGQYNSFYWPSAYSKSGATKIHVNESQSVVLGSNWVLPLGATITGSVTTTDGSSFSSMGMYVNAEVTVIENGQNVPLTFSSVVDSSGHYSLSSLPDGEVKLRLSTDISNQNFASKWWPETYSERSATAIPVQAGQTYSGKNFTLTSGTTVIGHVNSSAFGNPSIENLSVSAFDEQGNRLRYGLTDSNGDYTLSGLPEGEVFLYFGASRMIIPCDGGSGAAGGGSADELYAGTWFGGEITRATAAALELSAGQPLTVESQTMAPTSQISGRVISHTAVPINAAIVRLYRQVGSEFFEISSAGSYNGGRYTLPNVAAGTYRIGFSDCPSTLDGTGGSRYQEIYSGNSLTLDTATDIVVSEGETLSDVNAVLTAKSALGTLTHTPAQITGVTAVGRILSLGSMSWTPSTVSLTREWLADGEIIPGATGTTFTLTQAQLGKTVSARITARKVGFAPLVTTVSTNEVVAGNSFTVVGSPLLNGTLQVGQILTAAPGMWVPAGSYTYSWKRNGEPIPEATSATYLLTAADVGATMSVQVTAQKTGYSTSSVSKTATTPVRAAAFRAIPTPRVSGQTIIGQTLTAIENTWLPTPQSFSYVWKRDNVAIPNATSRTYVLTPADAGKRVSVVVTASKDGYISASAPGSASVPVIRGVFRVAPVPVITGTMVPGEVISVNTGSWPDSPESFTYTWKRSGSAAVVGTESTYSLTQADLGKRLTVIVTAVRSGYISRSVSSISTLPVSREFSGVSQPTISGTAEIGQKLTAILGQWTPTPTALSYQWRRNGVAIGGATRSTYLVTGADAGNRLTVSVTAAKSGYSPVQLSSAETAQVPQKTFTKSLTPMITGTTAVGQTIGMSMGAWSPAASFEYQWLRNGVPISGANAAQYTLVQADATTAISLRVTGSSLGYQTVTAVSESFSVQTDAQFTVSHPVLISGAARIGQVLTAVSGQWSPIAFMTYSWMCDGRYLGQDVDGQFVRATGSTYVPRSADLGCRISVVARAEAPNTASKSVTSAATSPVQRGVFGTANVPSILGVPVPGETLTVNTGVWPDSPESFTYAWKRSGTSAVVGTEVSYTLTQADLGRKLTVIVTAVKAGFISRSVASVASATVAREFDAAAQPTISGNPVVGQRLTANLGQWSPSPTSVSYQWLRDGVAISGATKSTYLLTINDAFASISVSVTGTKSGYTRTERFSPNRISVNPLQNPSPSPSPTSTPTPSPTSTPTPSPTTTAHSTSIAFDGSTPVFSAGASSPVMSFVVTPGDSSPFNRMKIQVFDSSGTALETSGQINMSMSGQNLAGCFTMISAPLIGCTKEGDDAGMFEFSNGTTGQQRIQLNSGLFTMPTNVGNYTFRIGIYNGGTELSAATVAFSQSVVQFTITFANREGSTGTQASITTNGPTFTLPTSTLTPPSGKQFAGWNDYAVSNTVLNAGATYTVTQNTELIPVWSNISGNQQQNQSVTFTTANSSFQRGSSPSFSTLAVGANVPAFTMTFGGFSGGIAVNQINYLLGDPYNNVFYTVPGSVSNNSQNYAAWDPASSTCGITAVRIGGVSQAANSGVTCVKSTYASSGAATQYWIAVKFATPTTAEISIDTAAGVFVVSQTGNLNYFATLFNNLGSTRYVSTSVQAFDAVDESNLLTSQSEFNPGNIISDANFFSAEAMSSSSIQNFLESRVPVCVIGNPGRLAGSSSGQSVIAQNCLKDYSQATPSMSSQPGLCDAYEGSTNESASTIIYKVGKACGISQKVLLVLLEKEQGLITDTWPLVRQYENATGFACSDSNPCESSYPAFFYQVWSAAKQFQRYSTEPFNWYPVGQVSSIRYHPNMQCGAENVLITNRATASLYYYTPYQPNAAALANMYGAGDSCSTYGNRNFWRLYKDWFGPTI